MPARSLSNGRLARAGSSLRVDNARIDAEEKPEPSAPRELRVVPGAGVDVAAIKRELRAVLDQLQG